MRHPDQDTSLDDHHWPPSQQSSSLPYIGTVSTSSGYSLLSNFRFWSVNIWREHACFVAVTSAFCDTLYPLSELIHHDQNIPGIHSPSESKIVPGSQGALSPCILLCGTWFLLQGLPVLTKLASSCTKKIHSLSMGLVCLIIWLRAASILWHRSKTSCLNSMKTTKILPIFPIPRVFLKDLDLIQPEEAAVNKIVFNCWAGKKQVLPAQVPVQSQTETYSRPLDWLGIISSGVRSTKEGGLSKYPGKSPIIQAN